MLFLKQLTDENIPAGASGLLPFYRVAETQERGQKLWARENKAVAQ